MMKTFQDYMNLYNEDFECYHHQKGYKLFLNCKYESIVVTVRILPMDVETIKSQYDSNHIEYIIHSYIKLLIEYMNSNKQYIRLKKFESLI